MTNYEFLEKGLEIVFLPHFVYDVSRKIFLMLSGTQQNIFRGRRGFVKWGLFHKHFVKSSKKKHAPHRKISEFFLLDTLKTTFWMVNLRMGISGPFPPKSGHFSLFLKKSSCNWPYFTVLSPLLLEILGNICITIACLPGCDATNFENNLIFLIKP